MRQQTATDHDLINVVSEVRALDPKGLRTRRVLRISLDQLYDGQRTGRYRWDQLYGTERKNGGVFVEINLQREFQFQDGTKLDFQIAGVDVDCKYSQTLYGWMIPPEALGHLCLLLWADDEASQWSMGLVRTSADRLTTSGNRDGKAKLNQKGRDDITWLFHQAALPPNILLQLDSTTVQRIMTRKSGKERINELFRSALGKIVRRGVVATVAQQDDYMKRVRANGGARTDLKPEGIIILGQYSSHADVARALGLPVPGHGESVSVRLAPAKALGKGVIKIDGKLWKVAKPTDPIVVAPDLPNI